jgi:phage/plasmid-associated DNA primase
VGNALPAIEDDMGSFWNKTVLTWYGKSWLGKEDHGLLDALRGELPHIASWGLQGAKRLWEAPSGEKWPKSEGSWALWRKAVTEKDPVQQWLEERCVKKDNGMLEKARAFQDYRVWAESVGVKAGPREQAAFTKAVEHGAWAVTGGWSRDSDGKNHRVFRGIRLMGSEGDLNWWLRHATPHPWSGRGGPIYIVYLYFFTHYIE